jgi:hypothetical protein
MFHSLEEQGPQKTNPANRRASECNDALGKSPCFEVSSVCPTFSTISTRRASKCNDAERQLRELDFSNLGVSRHWPISLLDREGENESQLQTTTQNIEARSEMTSTDEGRQIDGSEEQRRNADSPRTTSQLPVSRWRTTFERLLHEQRNGNRFERFTGPESTTENKTSASTFESDTLETLALRKTKPANGLN